MTRIIAGTAGGRRLAVPAGADTRPTSDRAREGLFSTLGSLTGSLTGPLTGSLTGAAVLDLYAGSGALGLEALSRGAATATLVECDPTAVAVLRGNVAALALPGATVVADRVERWVRRAQPPGYDVVLADPPYRLAADQLAEVLATLCTRGLIGSAEGGVGGIVAVERSSRDPDFAWPPGWIAMRTRRYGEAVLWYGRPA